MAEVEVFGIWGVTKSAGKVSSVCCGHEVTVAVVEPLYNDNDIDGTYHNDDTTYITCLYSL